MKIKVTFEDIIEVEDEEQAYDLMIEYCHEIAKNEDVTAFNFEEVKETLTSNIQFKRTNFVK
tara:strand:+ start:328 stop:513 length:186 start_codon:yes stop_codon:yes gene_type:complete